MPYTPYTNLQATPDFANFQFESPTLPEPTVHRIRFIGQPGGQVYLVDFRDGLDQKDKPARRADNNDGRSEKDFQNVLATTVQIIEIYSERYPKRILRFFADSPIKLIVFGIIFRRFRELLSPLFLMEEQHPDKSGPPDDLRPLSFRLRRRAIPLLTINTIQSTWNGTSRIFDKPYCVEVDKTIRVGLTLPTI